VRINQKNVVAYWLAGLMALKRRVNMEIHKNPKVKYVPYKPEKGKIISQVKRLSKYYYKKHGYRISIINNPNDKGSKESQVLYPYLKHKISLHKIANESTADDGNFFFYPTHKIYENTGNKAKHVGYRVRCIKLVIGDDFGGIQFKVMSLSYNKEEFRLGKWLEEKTLTTNGFKAPKVNENVEKLITDLSNMNIKKSIIIFSIVGWNLVDKNWYYVPFSRGGVNENIYELNYIHDNFKFEIDENTDEVQAYKEMQRLLEITNKQITVPLLSFMVISSLLTLVEFYNNEFPRFLICLSGTKEGDKEELANLFCTIYNRSKHIKRLDGIIHTNFKLETKLLQEKVDKVRDAVFIGKINNEKDKKSYLKLIDNNNSNRLSCGLLMLSDTPIHRDSVLNINIEDMSIDEEILEFHKTKSAVFTTWFSSFISFIQKSTDSPKWRVSNKGKMDMLYDECKDRLDDGIQDYDINQLRHNAWLLMGYMLFLRHGLELQVLSKKDFDVLVNDAVVDIRQSCKIDSGGTIEKLNKNISTGSHSIEDLAITFLNALNKIVTDEKIIGIDDKSKKTEQGRIEWGRIDGNTLYLENTKVFNFVKESTKGNKIELEFEKDSKSIYQHLYKKDVIITKEVGKEIRYGKRLKQVHYIDYDIKLIKEFLLENECELIFFKDK